MVEGQKNLSELDEDQMIGKGAAEVKGAEQE